MPYTPEEDRARREALYSFLLARGDKWTRMQNTVNRIDFYPAYGASFHNSGSRRLLTADIEAINSSDKFEKIIVSGSRGIKIANETDFEKFLTAEFGEVFRKLRRVRTIARKGSKDQQIDLEGQIREAFLGGD